MIEKQFLTVFSDTFCLSFSILLSYTGLCNSETSKGIFRRNFSSSRMRLTPNQAQSCPTSPKYSNTNNGRRISKSSEKDGEDEKFDSISAIYPAGLCSTSTYKMTRSVPAGLYSYTGCTILVLKTKIFLQTKT